jgi:hypothetical protein
VSGAEGPWLQPPVWRNVALPRPASPALLPAGLRLPPPRMCPSTLSRRHPGLPHCCCIHRPHQQPHHDLDGSGRRRRHCEAAAGGGQPGAGRRALCFVPDATRLNSADCFVWDTMEGGQGGPSWGRSARMARPAALVVLGLPATGHPHLVASPSMLVPCRSETSPSRECCTTRNMCTPLSPSTALGNQRPAPLRIPTPCAAREPPPLLSGRAPAASGAGLPATGFTLPGLDARMLACHAGHVLTPSAQSPPTAAPGAAPTSFASTIAAAMAPRCR